MEIVFAIDAGEAMVPLIGQLQNVLCRFASSFFDDEFRHGGLRLGLVACNAERGKYSWKYGISFLEGRGRECRMALYGKGEDCPKHAFFQTCNGVADVETFARRLNSIRFAGEGVPLLALDCALDFPFDNPSSMPRLVVLISSKGLSVGLGGCFPALFEPLLTRMMDKACRRHVGVICLASGSNDDDWVGELVSEYPRSYMREWNPERESEASDDLGDHLCDYCCHLMICGVSHYPYGYDSENERRDRAVFGQDAWGDDRWA